MIKLKCLGVLFFLIALTSCTDGGDGGSNSSGGGGVTNCTGSCANATSFLSTVEVQRIIAQAVGEAQARNLKATIAVVDRVGNVLAVFRMGAAVNVTITSQRTPAVTGGLEGLAVDSTLAAIAKAITGAYLSSEGNAFTSRTANQIVQEHFNPGETGQPGGPLFGVQFSQLACSDFSANLLRNGVGGNFSPKSSPLGLSADPGGLPLYKDGTPIGGIGVIADGIYGLDLDIANFDSDNDELMALAGQTGLAPPVDVRADRITVDGKTLRYVDDDNLFTDPASSADFASINGVAGTIVAVPGFFAGTIINGVAFGQPASGIEPDQNAGNNFPGLDAFVITDGAGTNLYPPRAGTQLTAQEVTTILQSALAITNKARAQIRRPLGSQARVTISVVDTDGSILGIVRARDAPMFGTDVSIQKARTAMFFSSTTAAADLTGAGFILRVTAVQNFVGASALMDGIAFSDRAGGNLSRPFYPDGIDGNVNGPFSNPFASWSPFSVGLQLELVIANLATTAAGCSTIASLGNGIQIFPGSVPIYRGNTLIGGIGVSGDGVDQDDMISFLGLHNAGQSVNVNNAPVGIRADTLSPMGVQLRYVQCPQTPFLNSNAQNVCAGK